ncbi:MAG: dCTP deaminase [Candidatus Aenigmatarchaeota archaeon]
MILPDQEIRRYLEEGKIVIKPMEDPKTQIQPAQVDLRLGNEFRVFRINSVPYIDTKAKTRDYTETKTVRDGDPFIIHPGEFVLGTVKEYIKMPDDLVGTVDGRSSLGRVGVVIHATSTSINPGWEGKFVLEITNIGKMPVALYPGQRVAKLAFHKLSSPAERPYHKRETKYQGQETIQETKMHED